MTILYVGWPKSANPTKRRLAEVLEGYTVEPADMDPDSAVRIDTAEIDCVVSELDLGDRSGVDFLRSVRECYPDLPFVLLAKNGSEEIASRAITAGVSEYCRIGPETNDLASMADRITRTIEAYRTHREVERHHTHLQAIVENTDDGVITIDSSSTIRFANPAVEDLFGYAPDDLVGESLTRLIPERVRNDHLTALARYLETGERSLDWHTVELTGLHTDRTEIPISVSFTEFKQEGEWRATGIIRDISESARIEAELREQKERFRQLAENLSEVVWIVDPDTGDLEYVNPAFEEVWGRPVERSNGEWTSFLDGIHPDDRERVADQHESNSTGQYDEEYRVVRPDGETRWVRDRAIPVEGPDGSVSRIIGIASDVTEYKERERTLRRSQRRFQHLQRFAGAGYWELDSRSDQPYDVTISEELYRIHGISPDEPFDLRRGLDFYHPEDRPRVEQAIELALSEGVPYDLEARLITDEGDQRWVHTICEPIEEDDEVVVLRGALQDITAQKTHERELQRTIDRVTDAIVKVDADWQFTFLDSRAEEIYDVSAGDLLGRGFWDVFADALGTRFETTYRRVMETREPASLEEYFEGLDGWFQVNVYPNDDGGLSFYFRDITERKERERKLELRTALLEAQSEATIDGLLIVDENRNIIQYNDRFLEIWGIDQDLIEKQTDDEAILERVADRLANSEEFLEKVAYLYDHPFEKSRDVIELTDGRFLDRHTAPVIDDDGTHFGRLWVFRDISERIENERKLEEQKERLEAFASIVSHDLRNPMNVAEGHLELVRRQEYNERLDQVAAALGRMRTLVEDLLALARANESITDVEPVDLPTVVEHCWQNVPTQQATLRVETTRRIMADKNRLGQVLENLIRNAVQHGGEAVTITVTDIDGGFAIEDTGPGIPMAEHDRIFESGYSSEPGGTGLGLSIVRTVVEAHGWEVTVTEGRDGGARFEITGADFQPA